MNLCSCCGKPKKPPGLAGMGTALKPAMELIAVARKPLSEPTIAKNIWRWGTGALNIDACRVGFASEDDATGARPGGRATGKPLSGLAGIDDDRAAFVASDNSKGRWPANLVHDGSPEVLAAFPDSAPSIASDRGERTAMFSESVLPDGGMRGHTDNGGSAARFFFSAKADEDSRLGSKHPTIKPVALIRWLCKLVCPPGGTILDCFAGTGTTGEAAYREGFNAVLIERETEYLADIARRIALAAEGQMTRKHESAKARAVGKAPDHGPLFGGIEVAGGQIQRSSEQILRRSSRTIGPTGLKW